jgi:hypothetical protein
MNGKSYNAVDIEIATQMVGDRERAVRMLDALDATNRLVPPDMEFEWEHCDGHAFYRVRRNGAILMVVNISNGPT